MAKILILLLMVAPMTLSAQQYKYSIDAHPPKKHHVPIKYRIETMKQDMKQSKEQRQIRHENEKASKLTIKNTYRIQTKKVKKRMIASRKKADIFNGDESIWYIMKKKIQKLYSWI